MAKSRTIQRTPNLGLTLRMTKTSGSGCAPEIGPARWWNPKTGDYDLETLVVQAGGYYSTDVYFDNLVTLFHAQVTGNLCGCGVTWAISFVADSTDSR